MSHILVSKKVEFADYKEIFSYYAMGAPTICAPQKERLIC
jgi:hypothetical protein